MSAALSVISLQLRQRRKIFLVPLLIMATVAAVDTLIAVIVILPAHRPGSPGWIEACRESPGFALAFGSFYAHLGAASAARTFRRAVQLGVSRHAVVTGMLAGNALVSGYIAVIMAANQAEQATGHWFSSDYIFDADVLGSGDTRRVFVIVFLGVLAVLSAGGALAAAWLRYGAHGPWLLGAGSLAVAGLTALALGAGHALTRSPWPLAIAAGVAITVSPAGTWLMLRRVAGTASTEESRERLATHVEVSRPGRHS